MSSRPRRSAAQKASVAITDMADRDNNMSSRSRRSADSKGLASVSRGPPSSSPQRGEDKDHTYLTVKLPSSKLRQATASRTANQISVGGSGGRDSYGSTRRSARGGKKSYVVESSEDEDEEEEEAEEQDEIEVGGERIDDDDEDDEDEEMEDLGDEDADGEVVEDDDMDVDAEGEDDDLGEEDAEGDIDMDVAPTPTIKISKPSKGAAQSKSKPAPPPKRTSKATPVAAQTPDDDDDDDEELSDLESDEDDEEINATMDIGGDEDAEGEEDEEEEEDVDAEGEEIEVAEEDDDDDLGSGGETPGGGSRGETPDLAKMTVRQRARFEEPNPAQYQALSNEIQAKKVFTAEEISMRRAEMARRRRNLSEKRNEDMKMETINKLLKKQAPKTNRKALQAGGDETPDDAANRPHSVFIRWISSKEGSRVAVTEEIMNGPAGNVFKPNAGNKMVQEVS